MYKLCFKWKKLDGTLVEDYDIYHSFYQCLIFYRDFKNGKLRYKDELNRSIIINLFDVDCLLIINDKLIKHINMEDEYLAKIEMEGVF